MAFASNEQDGIDRKVQGEWDWDSSWILHPMWACALPTVPMLAINQLVPKRSVFWQIGVDH